MKWLWGTERSDHKGDGLRGMEKEGMSSKA